MPRARPAPPQFRHEHAWRDASLLSALLVLSRARIAYRSARASQGSHLMVLLAAHLGEVEPSGDELRDEGLWRLRAAVVGPRLASAAPPGAIDRYFDHLRLLLEDQLEPA
jgi:hypothetical protein